MLFMFIFTCADEIKQPLPQDLAIHQTLIILKAEIIDLQQDQNKNVKLTKKQEELTKIQQIIDKKKDLDTHQNAKGANWGMIIILFTVVIVITSLLGRYSKNIS